MVSDAFALELAIIRVHMAVKMLIAKYSYGLVRTELLIALISVLIMLAVVIYIIVEVIARLQHPRPVQGGWVMIIAFVGIVINIIILKLLSYDHAHGKLNTRAVIFHVVGDLLGYVAAIVVGAVIYFTGWWSIDPIISMVLSCIILFEFQFIARSHECVVARYS